MHQAAICVLCASLLLKFGRDEYKGSQELPNTTSGDTASRLSPRSFAVLSSSYCMISPEVRCTAAAWRNPGQIILLMSQTIIAEAQPSSTSSSPAGASAGPLDGSSEAPHKEVVDSQVTD